MSDSNSHLSDALKQAKAFYGAPEPLAYFDDVRTPIPEQKVDGDTDLIAGAK